MAALEDDTTAAAVGVLRLALVSCCCCPTLCALGRMSVALLVLLSVVRRPMFVAVCAHAVTWRVWRGSGATRRAAGEDAEEAAATVTPARMQRAAAGAPGGAMRIGLYPLIVLLLLLLCGFIAQVCSPLACRALQRRSQGSEFTRRVTRPPPACTSRQGTQSKRTNSSSEGGRTNLEKGEEGGREREGAEARGRVFRRGAMLRRPATSVPASCSACVGRQREQRQTTILTTHRRAGNTACMDGAC